MNYLKAAYPLVMLSVFSLPQISFAASNYNFSGHHLYVNTNDAANKVIHYAQTEDGQLIEMSRLPTMGKGTAGYKHLTGQQSAPDSIVSSGALTISGDNKYLFVVNAGDNSVSSFRIDKNGELEFINDVSTGENGVSNTLSYNDKNQMLYVGHSLGPNHIKVFNVKNGHLTLIKGTHTVNTGNARDRILTQVQIDPSGNFLLANAVYDKRPEKKNGKFELTPSNAVDENGLAVFPILQNGDLGQPEFFDAGGESPFGLKFIEGRDGIFVNTLDSDPGKAVLNKLDANGDVEILSSAVAPVSGQGKEKVGTCWISYSTDGKVAFVTGYDSGQVVSFRISDEHISLSKSEMGILKPSDLSNDSAAVNTGSPIGSWSSSNGYFYQLYPAAAKLVAYKMSDDELKRVGSYAIPLNSSQGIAGF
ncbi:beta-propeller fold lactonase family protein [Scandinavium goeteborgense]|uniref:beta-propeller fold lactonase family protein n=1 Tax=Scandinavium goeteborgense TaxID=1851514 RepID=UPI00144707F9|nr:beta-propeller fold lactonase family protein [Scandinavium goeteborgense]QKN79847.1 beta-propeller fold lactonase family protein [Scandinavium goeteborgense]